MIYHFKYIVLATVVTVSPITMLADQTPVNNGFLAPMATIMRSAVRPTSYAAAYEAVRAHTLQSNWLVQHPVMQKFAADHFGKLAGMASGFMAAVCTWACWRLNWWRKDRIFDQQYKTDKDFREQMITEALLDAGYNLLNNGSTTYSSSHPERFSPVLRVAFTQDTDRDSAKLTVVDCVTDKTWNILSLKEAVDNTTSLSNSSGAASSSQSTSQSEDNTATQDKLERVRSVEDDFNTQSVTTGMNRLQHNWSAVESRLLSWMFRTWSDEKKNFTAWLELLKPINLTGTSNRLVPVLRGPRETLLQSYSRLAEPLTENLTPLQWRQLIAKLDVDDLNMPLAVISGQQVLADARMTIRPFNGAQGRFDPIVPSVGITVQAGNTMMDVQNGSILTPVERTYNIYNIGQDDLKDLWPHIKSCMQQGWHHIVFEHGAFRQGMPVASSSKPVKLVPAETIDTDGRTRVVYRPKQKEHKPSRHEALYYTALKRIQ